MVCKCVDHVELQFLQQKETVMLETVMLSLFLVFPLAMIWHLTKVDFSTHDDLISILVYGVVS